MELLTKEKYDKMAAKWAKHSVVYQKWDRYKVRFPTLLKHIDMFKGKNVLEVGSNAGLAGYHISSVSNSYFGVEGQEGYYRQALETQKFMANDNVEFLNMSVKAFMKRRKRGLIHANVNAVFLSYVLYHFSDKEVQMFADEVLPSVDTIVVMSRYAERGKKGRRKHNSYSFWHPDNVVKFLEKNGFVTKLEWGPEKKFHFVIGEKGTELSSPFTVEGCMQAERGLAAELANDDLEESTDEDKGEVAIHTEGEDKATGRRSTRGGSGRVAQRKSRGTSRKKADTEGSGEDVRAKEYEDRSGGVLQPVVGEGSETAVCGEDVPEVVEAPSDRGVSETGEDSID